MKFLTGPTAQKIGFFLARVVVPLWVLTGAMIKLAERTPKLLPGGTFEFAIKDETFPVYTLLATLVALELFAVAIMLFVARLARPMAIFMTASFVLILANEIRLGNADCGCLGSFSPNIWVMLAIDATLLLGVCLFPARGFAWADARPKWAMPAAAVWTVLGAAVTFLWVQAPTGGSPAVAGGNGAPPTLTPAGCGSYTGSPDNENPRPLPQRGLWFTPDDLTGSWVGQRWCEIELLQFMHTWPREIEKGERFVVFYGRTCDHCEDMFNLDFWDPELQKKLTVVEVPASRDKMTASAAWEMPEGIECEYLELPLGIEWYITTPLAMKIVDGIVECAEEGGHGGCMFGE